jgi:hypothetical protein
MGEMIDTACGDLIVTDHITESQLIALAQNHCDKCKAAAEALDSIGKLFDERAEPVPAEVLDSIGKLFDEPVSTKMREDFFSDTRSRFIRLSGESKWQKEYRQSRIWSGFSCCPCCDHE